MRATVAGLLVAIAACGAETSTPPEPVATAQPTTIAATTTVATTKSSEPEEECEGADRGFLCPPDLPLFFGEEGGPAGAFVPNFAAAGTYRTRVFAVPIEFTRPTSFQTVGEHPSFVNLDWQCVNFPSPCQWMWVYATGASPVDLEAISRNGCVDEHELEDLMLAGHPATYLEFAVPSCEFVIDGLGPLGGLPFGPCCRSAFYSITISDRESVLFWYEDDPADGFVAYEAEVAAPILDSMRFLDD